LHELFGRNFRAKGLTHSHLLCRRRLVCRNEITQAKNFCSAKENSSGGLRAFHQPMPIRASLRPVARRLTPERRGLSSIGIGQLPRSTRLQLSILNLSMEKGVMTLSGNGWSSNSDHDFSSEVPQTTEEYEFDQPGKSTKAVIGLGILVAFALVLAFMHPANHGATSSSPMVSDSARTNNLNNAPGQTTGQAPSTSAPSTPAN
jgi:hypothetical protein